MKTQCDGCAHWQARGGIILERQYECTQLADAVPAVNSSLARLLTLVASDFAAQGRCPMHEPLDTHPDAYRSQDLVDQG